MTGAVVPAFRINSVLMPSPSDYQWKTPEILGYDGSGKSRNSPYYSVTLTWNYMSYEDFGILMDAYDAATGIVSVVLPEVYNAFTSAQTSYTYLFYDHVRIDRPVIEGPDFQNYRSNIKMTIRKLAPGIITGISYG